MFESLSSKLNAINKNKDEWAETTTNKVSCVYCECNYLDGFNRDLLNGYTKDNIGVSLTLNGDNLEVEVDLVNRIITNFVQINYCPVCGRSL